MIITLILFQLIFGAIVFMIMWSGIKENRKQAEKKRKLAN